MYTDTFTLHASDHVDVYWDVTDDDPRRSPAHASDDHGLQFSADAATGGAVPESDAEGTATLHDQPVAESDASDLTPSYQCTQCN